MIAQSKHNRARMSAVIKKGSPVDRLVSTNALVRESGELGSGLAGRESRLLRGL